MLYLTSCLNQFCWNLSTACDLYLFNLAVANFNLKRATQMYYVLLST
jgi:hypothetical protein